MTTTLGNVECATPVGHKPQRQPLASLGVVRLGSMNQVLLTLGNVKAFRGYSVTLGIVQVTDCELVKHLDENYSEVVICNFNVKPGGALLQLAPLMFASIKEEYQEELQSCLQSQLVQSNDVDIEFHQ